MNKYLFIDRDGTLIKEPEDYQIDSYEKFALLKDVILSLKTLSAHNFRLVMISNQDGLGTIQYPHESFEKIQKLLLNILNSQGVFFEDILICPHFEKDNCFCRKPNIGLIQKYLVQQSIDIENSFVIGDRETDIKFAENINVKGLKIESDTYPDWQTIVKTILAADRTAEIFRKTNETEIELLVNLDIAQPVKIFSGLNFLDHMLEQFALHSGISIELNAKGDIAVDDHHTVEDIAIVLGQALRKALGDKIGINRYGFVLPMDESLAQVSIDLSGRGICCFDANFNRETIGDLATELIPHFFQSLSNSLGAAIHITAKGINNHHLVESIFKGFGRCLRQAVQKNSQQLPSTKGIL